MTAELKTTTAEALLGMLGMGPMSGYDLKQTISHSIGNFWTESYGQIYPALSKLESAGLVASEEKGKAGRKVYQLTEAGRERLEQWLTITPRPRVPRHETLLKLFLGSHVPVATSLEHISDLRGRFAADLQRYEGIEAHLRRTYPDQAGLPYWLMTLHYGRDEARMIVHWCDETTGLLRQIDARKSEIWAAKKDGDTDNQKRKRSVTYAS